MRLWCFSWNCPHMRWMRRRCNTRAYRGPLRVASRLDRYPDFEATHSGLGIELVAVALEIRRIGYLVPRFRQPLAPDCHDCAADGRDMLTMGKHGISLRADPHATEAGGKIGKIGHFHACDVIEIALVISIVGNAERVPAGLTRNVSQIGHEALQLGRDSLAGLGGVTLAQTGNEQRPAGLEARRLEVSDQCLIHFDCLPDFNVPPTAFCPTCFAPQPELLAKGAR